MSLISIRAPIWKNRAVGIAEYKMSYPNFEIEIIYKDKNGDRLYPGIYRFSKERAFTYPV